MSTANSKNIFLATVVAAAAIASLSTSAQAFGPHFGGYGGNGYGGNSGYVSGHPMRPGYGSRPSYYPRPITVRPNFYPRPIVRPYPVARPYPVFVRPGPYYVQPRPVIVERAPIYRPAPVVIAAPPVAVAAAPIVQQAPLVQTMTAAPVPVAASCNCLTKQYTPEGAVVFNDICTRETASVQIAPAPQAMAPQVAPPAQQ